MSVWLDIELWVITGNIYLCAALQIGALQWMQICVHRPDQELSGWVRGGEKNKSDCCGSLNESVGEHSGGKHDAFMCSLFTFVIILEILMGFILGFCRKFRVYLSQTMSCVTMLPVLWLAKENWRRPSTNYDKQRVSAVCSSLPSSTT